jgi:hypothetical protein
MDSSKEEGFAYPPIYISSSAQGIEEYVSLSVRQSHHTTPHHTAPDHTEAECTAKQRLGPPVETTHPRTGETSHPGFMDTYYLLTYSLGARKEGEWRDREREE